MIGVLSIVLSVLVTSAIFFNSKIINPSPINLWIFLAQSSGIFGALLLSWNYILATRLSIVEKIFGGLDKVYKTHTTLGHLAFILILNHPVFLLIGGLPNNLSKLYLIPSLNNMSYAFGIVALYVFIILLIFTIFIDLPYSFWKKTHELMGIVIILAILHSLYIVSDVSRYLPLRYWLILWNFIAILAFIYKRFIYYIARKRNNYVVKNIEQDKNYIVLTLAPTELKNMIIFKSGQFAFFSIGNNHEEHPFSILEQNEGEIKIGTKIIGKFTLEMANLSAGAKVSVNGPFGMFSDSVNKAKEVVFISGGIGITPFLSMIKEAKDKNITMIHTAKSGDSNLLVNIFINYSYYFPNFKFIHHLSDNLGRLNRDIVKGYANLSNDTYVYLCGPTSMMEFLSADLPKAGIKRKRIIFEDFKLK